MKLGRFYPGIFWLSLSFLWGCATGYHPLSDSDTLDYVKKSNEDMVVWVSFQGFGENGRFRMKAEEEEIGFINLRVYNKSTEKILFHAPSIYLRYGDSNTRHPSMSAKEVSGRMKLATWPYWLWSVLWVNYSRCSTTGCRQINLPIGAIIGLINFGKAVSTNTKFRTDLDESAFSTGYVGRNGDKSGLLYFNRRWKDNAYIVIPYKTESSEIKRIIVQYRL